MPKRSNWYEMHAKNMTKITRDENLKHLTLVLTDPELEPADREDLEKSVRILEDLNN
jgi:hypothetical protein